MICRVATADDIVALLEYLLSQRDRQGRHREVSRLGGPAGRSFDGTVGLFEALARLRPSLGRNVGHASLRLAPEDRRLSRDEWREAAGRLAEGAFGADTWTSFAHGDTHVHVVWSRVRRDGTTVCHHDDRRRAEMVARELERLFNLAIVPSSWQLDPQRSPAPPRPVPAEAPGVMARREAVWVAWQASERDGTRLRVELARRGLFLVLDEALDFCVDLAHDRRVPLLRILVDCARQAGSHPPRERDVLSGLGGLCVPVMDTSWPGGLPDPEVADKAPAPASAAPAPVIVDHGPQTTEETYSLADAELPPTGASPAPAPPVVNERSPTSPLEPSPGLQMVPNPAFAAWKNDLTRLRAVCEGRRATLLSARDHQARLAGAGLTKRILLWLKGTWTGQDALQSAWAAAEVAAQALRATQQELERLQANRPDKHVLEWIRPGPRSAEPAGSCPADIMAGHCRPAGTPGSGPAPPTPPRRPPATRPVNAPGSAEVPRRGSVSTPPPRRPAPG